MKSPTIYDIVKSSDGDKRVLNQEATVAAREKQKRIKQRFAGWLFDDPERAESLVRIYNDGYNNIRLREFDGSHLTFPGMSADFQLRPHQANAVWRNMADGNTLLAHVVGAGKSSCMAATAMKMRQTGLVRRNIMVVPNHMIEQFGREFYQVYPNAKLLVAGKEDLAKDRRKLLTAKIATGDWDAVITTHSSFERIGMSPDYQKAFLQREIADYNDLLIEAKAQDGREDGRKHKNMLKQIEKRKAAFEDKLKALCAETKKDDGVVFDDLGVDHMFVDECFSYDTLVKTEQGQLKIGDIVSNKIACKVSSWNSASGEIEWKPITNWFPNRRKGKLVEVHHEHGSFICTPEHKVWVVGSGYKKVCQLREGDVLYSLRHHLQAEAEGCAEDGSEILLPEMSLCEGRLQENLRDVSERVQLSRQRPSGGKATSAPVLQRVVQDEDAKIKRRNRATLAGVDERRVGQSLLDGEEEPESVSMDLRQQPNETSGMSGQGVAYAKSNGSQAERTRWEREDHHPTSSSGSAHRADNGMGHQHEANQALDGRSGQALQGRLGGHRSQVGCGGGRRKPSVTNWQSERCEEGQGSVASRLVRVEVLEPGSDGEYRFGGRSHTTVYDIEVADNHNYFANGVLVSNCHQFKNLSTATKMDRVSGIQTEGSQRAFDIYMKTQYLHEKTPGRGVTFATGTPISNTMVEMYTMMRYLAPDWLRERGLEHFDAWAAAFGEVVDTMEISPDGASLRPNSRFAKFVNLPELQQGFRSFADVQTADMLKLPVPKLKGGKAAVATVPMCDTQASIQTDLVARYERIRRGGVDPRDDNALAITTDGRKLALDARLVDPYARDEPDSKINAVVGNVVDIWRRSAPTRGTQMIFCDIGVNPTEWGFSVYQEIKDKLARAGIPAGEVADIGDANTDAKKEALFEKMREGRVRVLLGSTAKMGTGTNVQKRLIAKHDLDAPWKPADIEQRDGRILRQGNTNPEVEIHRYVTEGSFDAFMWQGLERKARFITQIMKGGSGIRKAEDIGGQELSFAEVKAIASGNPAILTLAEMEAELQKLSLLKRSHADDQYRARRSVKDLPDDIERLLRRAEKYDADHGTAEGSKVIELGGRRFGSRDKAIEAMNDTLKHHLALVGPETSRTPIGSYRGLGLTLETRQDAHPEMAVSGEGTHFLPFRSIAAGSLLNRIDDLVASLPEKAAGERQVARMKAGQLDSYRQRVGLAFDGETRLERLHVMRNELEGVLAGKEPEAGPERTRALVDEFNAMKGAPVIEHVPEPRHAEILPFVAPEPVSLNPSKSTGLEKAAAETSRPRLLTSQSRHPVQQTSLFDAPRRVPVKTETPVSWARKIEKEREKPRQLALF